MEAAFLRAASLGLFAALIAGAISPAAADASDGAVVDRAVEQAGATKAAANESVRIPRRGASPVAVSNEHGQFGFSLPAKGAGVGLPDGLTTQYSGTDDESSIAVQPLASGVRALIRINSEAAAEEYRFSFDGSVSSLVKNQDGSVSIIDDQGTEIGQVEAPWALDSGGREVPTHYEVDGAALVQVVEHRGGGYAYGIVADPSVWWWTKNTATCVAQVASILVPGKAAQIAAKITKAAKTNKKVRKAQAQIKALGGFVKAMKTVAKYVKSRGKGLSKQNRLRVERLFSYGGNVLVEIIGLGGCYTIYKEVK